MKKEVIAVGAVALICEYNPFHMGHKYQTELIKSAFPGKTLVCIMSGNYVQRGDLACADKYTRAKASCICGCDLVLEMIPPFCISSAESFAYAGVSIASRIGADTLAFGSECGDINTLKRYAEIIISPSFTERMKELVEEYPSLSYPLIREKCLEEHSLDPAFLRTPNNILGVEYIKAILNQGIPSLSAFTHKRLDGVKSASQIRELSPRSIYANLPCESAEVFRIAEKDGIFPVSSERLSSAVIYALRKATPEELSEFEACGGLEYRMKAEAEKARDINELITALSSKKYPSSRVRRAVFSAFLGIEREHLKEAPAYTNVLAFNEKGREFLSEIRKTSRIKIFTKPSASLKDEDEKIRAQSQRAAFYDSIYSLAMGKEGVYFMKCSPFRCFEK